LGLQVIRTTKSKLAQFELKVQKTSRIEYVVWKQSETLLMI
jgi:hypothetical protein